MATIPNGQKFHTVASTVDTENKGSAQLNAKREAFTMQDIIDTVGGAAYKEAVFRLIKSLTEFTVTELSNDTGLTFTWSATNSQTLHADVTGGALRDTNNNIFAWGTCSSPSVIAGNDLQILGAHLQSSTVDVREARIAADGSGITSELSFSGYLIIRRIVITP